MAEDANLDHIREIARRLCGHEVSDLKAVLGGGNNPTYQVSGGENRYALKFYPPQEADKRDRLGAEEGALAFLHRHGVAQVPRPLASSRQDHCVLYEWIEGKAVDIPGRQDIEAMAQFIIALQDLRNVEGADKIPDASDSSFSLTDLIAYLNRREKRLQEVSASFPELSAYLDREFGPLRADILGEVHQKTKDMGLDPSAELPRDQRILSPSDFGLHNALREDNGGLRFLDFEYFGWDDPAKTICDVMLHPGMALSKDLGDLFGDLTAPFFTKQEAGFLGRLEVLTPLYGLIWCLIMLNEFLPERWERRTMATATTKAHDQGAMGARQLEKARNLQKNILRVSKSVVFSQG